MPVSEYSHGCNVRITLKSLAINAVLLLRNKENYMDANRKAIWGIKLTLLLLLVLKTQAISAMGLGNIKVNSSLNEPLSASIPILKDSSERNIASTDLIVSIANADLHRNAGLAYPRILDDLRFNIVTDSNGQLVLNIYSVRSVYEPLLNFLVDLRWNGGQIVKEFSMILDPVSYTAPSQRNTSSAAITSNTLPAQTSRPTRTTRASRPVVLNGDNYQVQSGDSLSKIAIAVRAERGGNLDEIMQSIYTANPDAFLSSPDQLLANVQIIIPDYNVDSSEATTQYAQPEPTTTTATAAVAVEPEPVPTPEPTPATSVFQPRLEILPPDQVIQDATAVAGETNSSGSENTAMTEQALKMLEEEQQRNTRLENRNAVLEQKIDDMLESNQQMQIRLNQLIEQQQPQSSMSNFIRLLPWLLLALASLFLATLTYLFFKRKQQASILQTTPPYEYEAQATHTQRIVPDLDAYSALDSDAEPPYDATSEGLLDEDQLIDDLATSQELYEPTNIIDADVEATQTFMGSLEDVELDAGQNLDAAQEAEIYLAYQQYKLADKTIQRLIDSEPDNYKFQILKLQLLSKTGKMEELQELSVELLSRFPNRDDEVHQRIQEICDMAFSANMGGQAAATAIKPSEAAPDTDIDSQVKTETNLEEVPEYEETKEMESPTEPGLEMTALQDDITEFLNEDLTLSDTDPMLVSSIIDHDVETEINPDVEYTDISDQLTELMDDITEEGLDLPFDLETEILQEEEKRKILDQHNTAEEDQDEDE